MKFLKISFIFTCLLLLSGCISARKPNIIQYNTGIEKTKKWIEYNSYATKNNQPILDFAATTLKYKFNNGKVLNYRTFLLTDPKVVVQTQWHNCKTSDIYEFKFYMPDGRLYDYDNFFPKKDTRKWTLGRSLYVLNSFPSKIKGNWKVEIYANSKKVITKSFIIGNEKVYKKINPNINIGFFPFLDNEELSSWKHGRILPKYLSWATLYNNKNIRVVPTDLILKDLSNANFDYENFENMIIEDLKDNDGVILSISKKHKMDYIILGKVTSTWITELDTNVNTYIINVKKGKIVDKDKFNHTFFRSDFNIWNSKKSVGIHSNRVKLYDELYNKLSYKINKFK